MIHTDANAICVDNLSHEETAKVFRRCARFYCYDDATMYSVFAALCGCVSIVAPNDLYTTAEAWREMHSLLRYGVAYGDDDIPHALATRELMMAHLGTLEQHGIETVHNFVRLTSARFGFSLPRTAC